MEKREDERNKGGVLFRGHAGCSEAVAIAVEGTAAHLSLKDQNRIRWRIVESCLEVC